MVTLPLELPDDAFAALRRSPKEFVAEMRLAAAIYWYSRGELSQGKAAEIAGLNRADFLLELSNRKIDVFAVDFDDLRDELARG